MRPFGPQALWRVANAPVLQRHDSQEEAMRLFGVLAVLFLVSAAAAPAAERFTPLDPDKMTPEQKKVADDILSGPRKSLSGPFSAWLRSPQLADRLQRVGDYLRFHSSVPARLNEFAILITARQWTAQYEWYAHYPLALKAGLDPRIAAELAAGKRPDNMADDEALVYDFCLALHRGQTISDKLFDAAVAKLGEQGVVDLIAVNGYYDLVAMTLNAANVQVPAGVEPPLALHTP
jgi:4-carboxymuconolactone decarboxylase